MHQPQRPGAVAIPAKAISINLETTDILDAVEQSLAETATAIPSVAETAPLRQIGLPSPKTVTQALREPSNRETAVTGPMPEAAPTIDTAEAQHNEPRERQAEEALRKAEEERHKAEQRLARERERREAERLEREAKRRRLAEEKSREAAGSQAKAGASGLRGAQFSRGHVSASQGNIRNYAAAVRARIARNKPAGSTRSGSVVLAFTLSSSGNLISARIAQSSGDGALDQAALTALRRASPFPPPPDSTTANQLKFSIPFYFR